MDVTIKDGDTWVSLAESLTVGGAAYAPALALHNGWEIGSNATLDGLAFTIQDNTPVDILMSTIVIPDNWLKNPPAKQKSLLPVFLIIGGIITLTMVDTRNLFR